MIKIIVTPEGQQEVELTADEITQVNADAAAFATQDLAQAWLEYQNQARVLLDASDITFLRTREFSKTWPQAWKDYRNTLRAILSASSGDPMQPLPIKPDYPAGT